MKTDREIEQQSRLENEDALKLMRSEEWKQYVNFLKRKSVKLQKKVNDAVEKGDIVEAKVQLAMMQDCTKSIEAFCQQTLQQRANLNKAKEISNG